MLSLFDSSANASRRDFLRIGTLGRMGQVIGRSTRDGGDPASEPIRIRNLIATIMHYLLDINQVRVMRGIQGDVSHRHHRRRSDRAAHAVDRHPRFG